jgi:hypothetical protein
MIVSATKSSIWKEQSQEWAADSVLGMQNISDNLTPQQCQYILSLVHYFAASKHMSSLAFLREPRRINKASH